MSFIGTGEKDIFHSKRKVNQIVKCYLKCYQRELQTRRAQILTSRQIFSLSLLRFNHHTIPAQAMAIKRPVVLPLPAGPTKTTVGEPSSLRTKSACIVIAKHPNVNIVATKLCFRASFITCMKTT